MTGLLQQTYLPEGASRSITFCSPTDFRLCRGVFLLEGMVMTDTLEAEVVASLLELPRPVTDLFRRSLAGIMRLNDLKAVKFYQTVGNTTNTGQNCLIK